MLAHLYRDNGKYFFSGSHACGQAYEAYQRCKSYRERVRREQDDKKAGVVRTPRPFDAIVDVGREFLITWEGLLYLTGPGPAQFSLLGPDGTVLAARQGWFGFKIVSLLSPH